MLKSPLKNAIKEEEVETITRKTSSTSDLSGKSTPLPHYLALRSASESSISREPSEPPSLRRYAPALLTTGALIARIEPRPYNEQHPINQELSKNKATT